MNPWCRWEDWRAGLYHRDYTPDQVAVSQALLSTPDQFRSTALEMLREWPHAALQNLSFMWSGRNAWLGQASCLYAHGAPSRATCEAWGRLSPAEQDTANGVAVAVRKQWEESQNGRQTLFD